jgi:hypothetical protein
LLPSLYLSFVLIPILIYLIPATKTGAFPFLGVTMKLVECSWKVAVPIVYMLFPPTVAERDEFMEKDKFGVKRPKKRQVKRDGDWWSWKDVCEVIALGLMI